jgi:hypothetical protein
MIQFTQNIDLDFYKAIYFIWRQPSILLQLVTIIKFPIVDTKIYANVKQ